MSLSHKNSDELDAFQNYWSAAAQDRSKWKKGREAIVLQWVLLLRKIDTNVATITYLVTYLFKEVESGM